MVEVQHRRRREITDTRNTNISWTLYGLLIWFQTIHDFLILAIGPPHLAAMLETIRVRIDVSTNEQENSTFLDWFHRFQCQVDMVARYSEYWGSWIWHLSQSLCAMLVQGHLRAIFKAQEHSFVAFSNRSSACNWRIVAAIEFLLRQFVTSRHSDFPHVNDNQCSWNSSTCLLYPLMLDYICHVHSAKHQKATCLPCYRGCDPGRVLVNSSSSPQSTLGKTTFLVRRLCMLSFASCICTNVMKYASINVISPLSVF